ncbi:MAG: hypothetical protein WC725_05090 [Patescibacteria group bacterium]|jgi:hypothetical protein
MTIKQIIDELEVRHGVMVCRDGFEYTYILPNKELLRRTDYDEYEKITDLFRNLRRLAAIEEQKYLQTELKNTGLPARYILPDKRIIYIGKLVKNFGAFTLSKSGKISRYKHDGLILKKTFEEAQADLDAFAIFNKLTIHNFQKENKTLNTGTLFNDK